MNRLPSNLSKTFILLIDERLKEGGETSREDVLQMAKEKGLIFSCEDKNIKQRFKEAKQKMRELLKNQDTDFDEHPDSNDKRKTLFKYPTTILDRIKAEELDLVADYRTDEPRFRYKQLKELLAVSKGLLPDRLYSELSLCEMQEQAKRKIVEFEGNAMLRNIQLLPILFRAIRDEKVITFDYKPYGKPKRHVRLHPHFLKQFNNRWFLFGYAIQQDGEYKSNPYALDRICSEIENIKEKYIIPEDLGIDYNTFFDDIVGVSHRANAETVNIVIQTNDYYTHERIKSKPICPGRQTEIEMFSREKHYGKIQLRVKPNLELRGALLGFGSHITVIEPKEIRDDLLKEIEKMKNQYYKDNIL